VIGELGLSRSIGPDQELFLNVENAGDARVEADRTADGIALLGAPRWTLLGFRGKW
jgi:hypothetical protein